MVELLGCYSNQDTMLRKLQELLAASPLDEPLAVPAPAAAAANWLAAYRPLLIIAAYIAAAAFAGDGAHSLSGWMSNFMAGFFLVFSFFKLLDLPGFASAYAGYDLLAARWRPWGLIYPFAELAIGFAYLFRLAPMATSRRTEPDPPYRRSSSHSRATRGTSSG